MGCAPSRCVGYRSWGHEVCVGGVGEGGLGGLVEGVCVCVICMYPETLVVNLTVFIWVTRRGEHHC